MSKMTEYKTIVASSGYEFVEFELFKDENGKEDYELNGYPIVAFGIDAEGWVYPITVMGTSHVEKAHYHSVIYHVASDKIYSELFSPTSLARFKIIIGEWWAEHQAKKLQEQTKGEVK